MKGFSPIVAVALTLAICSCGTSSAAISSRVSPPRVSHPPVPQLHTIFLIMLENQEYSRSGGTPYLHSLRKQGALAANYFAITHPSLPNYLAILSGSTNGVTSDTFNGVLTNPTLVDQLDSAGLTWKAYMEDMPGPCFLDDSAGDYARRHDPFTYFQSVRSSQVLCDRIQPLTQLTKDLSTGPLPNFVWITPNLCHDGHSCDSASVDAFLHNIVPNITASLAYRHRGVLFITYDEGTSNDGCCRYAAGGHIDTLLLGPGIKAGASITASADHYSLLRTIEDGFRLPHLGGARCGCTSTLGAAWKQ